MKTIFTSLLVVLLLAAPALAGSVGSAQEPRRAPIALVATIPDLGDLCRAIGGPEVAVHVLTKGTENQHAVVARPSMLVQLSRADAFAQIGLSLESSWIPGLLEAARNERIAAGAAGFIDASVGWHALAVPQVLDRRGGDVHPHGNPHMNLDPRAGPHLAQRVLEALVRLRPEARAGFELRHAAWLEQLAPAQARWAELGRALRGRKLVCYHQEFDYFAAHHGMQIVGTVESKPGVPPTASHLAALVELMRAQEVDLILSAAWSNDRQLADLARRTGARVLVLPTYVGGQPDCGSWIELMDCLHRRVAEHFGVAQPGATPPGAEPPEQR
jgi:zinc/manganese transport system substrate-binding protein